MSLRRYVRGVAGSAGSRFGEEFDLGGGDEGRDGHRVEGVAPPAALGVRSSPSLTICVRRDGVYRAVSSPCRGRSSLRATVGSPAFTPLPRSRRRRSRRNARPPPTSSGLAPRAGAPGRAPAMSARRCLPVGGGGVRGLAQRCSCRRRRMRSSARGLPVLSSK